MSHRPVELTWIDDTTFSADGVEFVNTYGTESTRARFHIRKRRPLVEQYVALLDEFRGANVVELGIAQGGSLALLALVAAPRKAVAMELAPRRIRALDELLAERGLTSSVRPHYGVDQGDAARVRQIVRDELGDQPIDLVIDDASHLLGPSRSSFDVLFPLLRPGGLFVLEDWNCQHKMAHGFRRAASAPDSPEAERLRVALEAALGGDDPELRAKALTNISARIAPTADVDPLEPTADAEPLSALVIDLMIARACSGEVVSEVVVGEFWTAARRGPAALDPDTFRIAGAFADPYGLRWS